MRPTIILDKSVLEGLNPDEMVWLDQFYITNTIPFLYIEILVNLEKPPRNGNDPKKKVSRLAFKLPDLHSLVNISHLRLIEKESLEKEKIDMESGKVYIAVHKSGELTEKGEIIYKPLSGEEEKMRWENGDFNEEEIRLAKEFLDFKKLIPDKSHNPYEKYFANKPKSEIFRKIKEYVDRCMYSGNQREVLLEGFSLLSIPEELQQKIFTRWEEEGCSPIREFAPYLTYLITIINFLALGMHFGQIKRHTSYFIDISYFFYLPFCKVFTSNDNFHKDLFPLFSNKNQTFISGKDLKEDLKKLDAYYSSLPQEVKDKGISHYASSPPNDTSFLTTRLWDKYASQERREGKSGLKIDFKRTVRRKKGKWMRPPSS